MQQGNLSIQGPSLRSRFLANPRGQLPTHVLSNLWTKLSLKPYLLSCLQSLSIPPDGNQKCIPQCPNQRQCCNKGPTGPNSQQELPSAPADSGPL
ncbi:hypothetical protein O181_102598 [Austropuccinia psidii MF-1]|uniref:Uncharacterized protein n=1 Tax=Austropuccinia psidii MF-1 TaxID=1389203 RepID=A0A9Q3JGM8_9BASI|nr:hypothetical protein [Austropuccinia psidii MF-1]